MPKRRRNSRLFTVGTCETVDLETGASVPVEGGGLKMLPGPPGACEWCHTRHEPAAPHNAQSLPYQMKFHAIHGRWPTWTDAMAHLPPETRRVWRAAVIDVYRKAGLEIPDDLK